MKINEVTEAGVDYETNPQHKKLADIGRALMTHSETASMKGKDDNAIKMYNQMSSLGNTLTKFGTTWGPKSLPDVMKDEPEDDEFAAPDDDEVARQADARAAKRK